MPAANELTLQQKAQWSAAASGWERWDHWFERNSRDLTAWLCDAAGITASQTTLDLACGSGQPSATAAARVGPGGRVVATDLSPEMVEVTRRKARRLGLDNLDVREMDAQALSFPNASFDAATCRFGLMFCPDPVRAAAEVHRVLRPGGRFALAVWDAPAKNPFFASLAQVLAQFVPTPAPDPTAPGPFRLAPPGELERVLRAGGFSKVTVESRPMTMTYASIEEYWQIQTDLAAPLKAAIATLGKDDVTRLKDAAFKAVAPYVKDGSVQFAAVPLCAVAE